MVMNHVSYKLILDHNLPNKLENICVSDPQKSKNMKKSHVKIVRKQRTQMCFPTRDRRETENETCICDHKEIR